MHISGFRIENYKCFVDSYDQELSREMNVILGKNNTGKSALLEVLHSPDRNNPNRLLQPTQPSSSVITIRVTFTKEEAQRFVSASSMQNILISSVNRYVNGSALPHPEISHCWRNCSEFSATFKFAANENWKLMDSTFGHFEHTGSALQFNIKDHGTEIEPTGNVTGGINGLFLWQLFTHKRGNVFRFQAERPNIGAAEISKSNALFSNASNLAAVLDELQSRRNLFQEYKKAVRTVLDDISEITLETAEGYEKHKLIRIWTHEPPDDKVELSSTLMESGTGVGQVMAMLYVVMVAREPQVIMIDEPQSFLHPGAIRKLFDIFRQYPQHQYIITTHSPTVLSAANPDSILFISKYNMVSSITHLDKSDIRSQNLALRSLGAGVGDVFGADCIIWVEGPTEEASFRSILRDFRRHRDPITQDTATMTPVFLQPRSTGELNPKSTERQKLRDFYDDLSAKRGLLPPLAGYILDAEHQMPGERSRLEAETSCKSEQQQSTIQHNIQVRDKFYFLKRLMYENYLLHAGAIAVVLNSLDEFAKQPIAAEMIQEWLNNRREQDLTSAAEVTDEDRANWLDKVHGAQVLADLFKDFCQPGCDYKKTEHGPLLTEALLSIEPEALRPVAELIVAALQDVRARPSTT